MDGTGGLDLHTLGVIGLAVGITIALSFTLLSLVLRGMLALHIWAGAFWVLTLADWPRDTTRTAASFPPSSVAY